MRALVALALAAALSGGARAQELAWPDLGKPLPPDNRGAKDAALLIAVERYAELPSVPGAIKNVSDWQAYLTGTRGLPAESVTVLRDNEGTVEKIRKYARAAAANVKPGGTLWFVFIGHGAPAADGKDGVLVGYDAQQDADSVYARSLPQKDLLASLRTGKQARTVVVLDACFSGRAPDGKALVKGLQPLVVVTGTINRAALASMTILTAAKASQFAGPLPGAQRPAFSYLVLGGMRGWADENHDGHVTARELRDYSQQVLTATVKDRSQDPQLFAANPDLELAPAVEKAPDLAALQRGQLQAAVATGANAAAPNRMLTVAVAEFRAQGLPPDLAWLGRSFGDATILRLSKGKQVRVVEREYLDQIAAELKLQSSAMVDERSAVTMGRLLGARVFVFGSIAMMGDEVLVRARTVSVERGEVLDSQEVTGGKQAMLALQRDLATRIASALAVDAAVSNDGGLEVTQMTLAVYGDLERLHQLAQSLPFFGLDPARARKKSDYQLGISIADRILSQYPNLALAHFYRGLFALHDEDLARADQEAQIARRLGQDDIELALLRANIRYVMRDGNGALALFVEATARHADDSRAWYGAGRVFAEQNQPAQAAAFYLDAVARQPVLRAAETNLQTLLGGPNAAMVLDQLRAQRPDRFAAAATFTAFFHRDWNGAESLAARAQGEMPTLYMAPYMRGAGALARNDLPGAIGFLSLALQLRPSAPEVHRELGVALLRSGNCALGRNHEILYFRTANAITDGDWVNREINGCHL